jgi:hypothetical protein
VVAVGAFAVVFVAFVLFTWVRYFRYMIWVAHDRPAAMRRGCRVCGAPAVQATWHMRAPKYLRPFGPTQTVAWCQTHYEDARARNQESTAGRPAR